MAFPLNSQLNRHWIRLHKELEKFSQSYSKASSLSYAAGIADFDSVNNFSKEDAEEARNTNSNLAQTKEAIQEAKSSLDRLVVFLQKGTS